MSGVRELRTLADVQTRMAHGLLSTRTVLREDLVNEIKNGLDPALPLCPQVCRVLTFELS